MGMGGPAWGFYRRFDIREVKKTPVPGAAVDAEAPNSPDAYWLLLLAVSHVAQWLLGFIRRVLTRNSRLNLNSCKQLSSANDAQTKLYKVD